MKIEYYVEFGERSSHTGREVAWHSSSSSSSRILSKTKVTKRRRQG